MAYNHGVRTFENPTSLATPITGTAGLQVVVGVAPVNMADDPYSCTNTPMLAYSFAEASAAVGYNDDFANYNICESIDASFRVTNVAPIVLINVLDPKKHAKDFDEQEFQVVNGQAKVTIKGILPDKLTVKHGTAKLENDDYIITFDSDGNAIITILSVLAQPGGNTIKVSGKKIAPEMVEKNEIIGSYNAETGEETGLEVIRQVFPKLVLTPGLIVCPGWSKDPNIAAAIAAKCTGINGAFTCEAIVDLDATETGAKKYTDVKLQKDASAMVSEHLDIEWPCAKIGSKIYHMSAIKAAYTAYTDANNDDVPCQSPSNVAIAISGICLEDGTDVVLDEQQANIVNSYGVNTCINFNGWHTWGNRTAAYPSSSDPKDVWLCCRRMFSWVSNNLILTYHQRVDNLASYRLVQAIIDDENVHMNSLAAQGKIAGGYIDFLEADNPAVNIMNGKVVFRIHLAPWTPAEDICFELEFDPDILAQAFSA